MNGNESAKSQPDITDHADQPLGLQTTTFPTKPVKIKIEVIPDDEDDADSGCNGFAAEPNVTSTESDKTTSLPPHDGENDGAGGDKKTPGAPEKADDLDEVQSPPADHDDAESDDFNQHGSYSPFEGQNEKSECDDFSPIQDRDGNVVLEVDCGANSALLYVNKLCQGSKGQCIYFEDRWYTPNEFQFISGRETAKDWKRSIRHRGKSLKILMGRGLLRAHPLMCECDTCRLNFASKGGLRLGDRRVTLPTSSNTNGTLTVVDRSRLRRSPGQEGDGAQLNDIIDQLQHTNNSYHQNGHHSYECGRKRSLGVDSVSPISSNPSSTSASGLALVKRPRSISPREDDIYDEQQRKIFEAANSPEPHNIENLRRSLNITMSRSASPLEGNPSPNSNGTQSFSGGGVGGSRIAPTILVTVSSNCNTGLVAGPADLSRHSSTSPPNGTAVGSSGVVHMSQPPQMMIKHQTKSRKQTAPQHLDIGNTDEGVSQRPPHIVLSTYSGQMYNKANAAVRPRYQSTPVFNHRNANTNGSTVHHGNSGELNLSTNGTSSSRRSHSLLATTVRTPGNPVKMIELTRPEIVPSTSSGYSSGSRPSSTHSSNTTGDDAHASVNPSLGNIDTVFLPADMTSWNVADVTQFVQSLKGCEEYSQVFRDQAIDGEILPVLTEDHLLHNMGLKLGPALKIRLHVARRLGFTLDGQYCTTMSAPQPPSVPPSAQGPGLSTSISGPKSVEIFTEDM